MHEWWLLSVFFALTVLATLALLYPLRKTPVAIIILVPFIFISVGVAYYFWGGFVPWQHYMGQNESKVRAQQLLKSIKNPQQLINKLRAQLDESPKSAKGWYLLGRLYLSQHDNLRALEAFSKAHHSQPNNEQYTVNYAHSLWIINNKKFNAELITIFKTLLKSNPNQPDALAMLAMSAFIGHDYELAINYWQRLLKLVPEQSEESNAIRKAIANGEEQLKKQRIKYDR
ncbi:MAG: hypothetical protein PSV35_00965 [bacterium]|nr:hypothetical protein [bacterium]